MLLENLRHGGWSWLAICLLALPCVGGCTDSSDSLKWTEDVSLPDGGVVTLTRYQEFKGPHELGDAPTESDYWFEFKHPDTGKLVRWQSDRDLGTLALLIAARRPMLLTKPRFGSSEFRYGCPNPPYLLFEFASSEWRQVPVAGIPLKNVRVNMTYAPSERRDLIEKKGGHLSASETQNTPYQGRVVTINFEKPFRQTFGNENCGRNRDYLID